MPTGYTSKIYEGEPQTFREFALDAARGMGAAIMMRDMSPNTPLTVENVRNNSTYHAEQLALANEKLDRALAMTDEQAEQLSQDAHAVACIEWHASNVKLRALRTRYNEMLGRVMTREAPTNDHEGFKEFMVQQLQGSIDHDTNYDMPKPVRQTGAAYRQARVDAAWRDIAYHTDQQVERTCRNYERSEWVGQLLTSLPE